MTCVVLFIAGWGLLDILSLKCATPKCESVPRAVTWVSRFKVSWLGRNPRSLAIDDLGQSLPSSVCEQLWEVEAVSKTKNIHTSFSRIFSAKLLSTTLHKFPSNISFTYDSLCKCSYPSLWHQHNKSGKDAANAAACSLPHKIVAQRNIILSLDYAGTLVSLYFEMLYPNVFLLDSARPKKSTRGNRCSTRTRMCDVNRNIEHHLWTILFQSGLNSTCSKDPLQIEHAWMTHPLPLQCVATSQHTVADTKQMKRKDPALGFTSSMQEQNARSDTFTDTGGGYRHTRFSRCMRTTE